VGKSFVLMLCELSFVGCESSKLQGMVHVCFMSYRLSVSFSVVVSKLHDTSLVAVQGYVTMLF
jgi:hypothetical protein